MSKVVLDEQTKAKLEPLNGPIHVFDEAGKKVGVMLSPREYFEMQIALINAGPTSEERAAAWEDYRKNGGRTTSEILESFRKLEEGKDGSE